MPRPSEVNTLFAGHALPRGAGSGKHWDVVRQYIKGLEEDVEALKSKCKPGPLPWRK